MKEPNFRVLDLNLLRVFDEVMTHRNLTRAAQSLHMTQPAVSNALSRLREFVGDRLVARSGYGVEPTPRALALWPAVSEALRQLELVLAPGEFDPARATNTFVMAMADATAAELVPGLVERLEQQAPGISIRVVPLTTRDPRRLLDEGPVDLAAGYFPGMLADLATQTRAGSVAAFEHERLFHGRYVCVMRRDHPLAAHELTLDAYTTAHHLHVSFSGRPYGFADEALAALGRKRRIVCTVNQFFTAGQVVAHSDLLTVLPLHFTRVTGIEHDLTVRELPFELPAVHIDSVWHRRHSARAEHRWLRAAVSDAAACAFAAQGDSGVPQRLGTIAG